MTHYLGQGRIAVDEQAGTFRVSRDAFTSEDVLDAERDKIFDKCWLYIGHESEIREPGDFVSRVIVGREMIFNRDVKGEVHAFFNSCPHRGAKLCVEPSGKGRNFSCLYHGWMFDTDGKFRKLPHHKGYPRDFAADGSVDLVAAPRLDSYRGFFFLCFDKNVVDLRDYLGNAADYIDLFADQAEQIEVISGAQEYGISANWKLLCENTVDGYHADNLHATYFDFARNVASAAAGGAQIPRMRLEGVSRMLDNGHAVVEFSAPWGRPSGKWSPAWGAHTKTQIEENYARLVDRLGEERAHRAAHFNRNVVIFPNLMLVDAAGLVIRTIQPGQPGKMFVNTWAAGAAGEDDWIRQVRLKNFLTFLGPGGLATPDDIEALERCQAGYSNRKEAGWNDISKGALDATELPMEDEGQIRAFWREWARRLDGEVQPVTAELAATA